MFIKPLALKKGDVIGIVAPSDAVDRVSMEPGIDVIKSWGLKVKMGKYVYSKVGDFMAGEENERQEDLLEMINDDEVKAIWAATGGYAATEVLPIFNRQIMEKLAAKPKWFIGYSDVCMILNALTSYKMVSIMAPTVWGLYEWDEESQEVLRKMLFGEEVAGIGPEYKWKAETKGVAIGRIVAADLETLILSFGTRFDPIMYGSGQIILAIEELDIEKSTLQRQIDVILSHKRANRISGIIIGRLVNIRELSYPEWGKDISPQQVIVKRVKKWSNKIPLVFLDDFGHAEWDYKEIPDEEKGLLNHKFLPIPNGIMSRLEVGEMSRLQFLEPVVGKEEVKPEGDIL